MDRILIILKKENGPRASSAPALGLNTIIFKHVYWYMQQTQVSVYRTIGPLVSYFLQIMSVYNQTYDPNILIGHCDLISRFSDFAFYLDTQLVYEQTSFTEGMTKPLTLK